MAPKYSGKPIICAATCFTVFIIISLLTHIAEIFLNSVYIYYLHTQTSSAEWTATTLGFLILPIVIIQLFSAILHLQWRAANSKDSKDTCFIATVHVLQLGFVWRHLKILNEADSKNKKKFLADILLLRLAFAFTSGLPQLLLQTHYIINGETHHSIQVAAMTITLLSTAWALASFRRQNECCEADQVILTWPGIFFKLLWRIGEITARILSLAVFVGSYHHWIFLVFGFHWFTMIVCVWTSILGPVDFKNFGRCSRLVVCLAIGYVYIFNHINFSNIRAKYRYSIYYGIIFFETCILVAAWILNSPTWNERPGSYYFIAIIASAFIVAIISMVAYYSCFHIELSSVPVENSDVCIQDGCINCRLSLCAKHSKVLQRPFNTGYVSPYDKALYKGHYFKNMMQDSLFDSQSEFEDRAMSNSSVDGREVELILKSPNPSAKQVCATVNLDNKKDHQNCHVYSEAPIAVNTDIIKKDNTARVYSEAPPLCRRKKTSRDRQELGTQISKSAATSKLKLDHPNSNMQHSSKRNAESCEKIIREVPKPIHLTKEHTTITSKSGDIFKVDIVNNLDNPHAEKVRNYLSESKERALVDTVNTSSSLLRMEADHWYSDGYTTDNSLGGYNLPVTRLVLKPRESTQSRETNTQPTMADNTDIESLDSGQGSDRKTPLGNFQDNLSQFRPSATPFMEHSRTKGNNSQNLSWYDCSVSGESTVPQLVTSEISSYSFDSDSDGSPEMII